MWVSGSFYFAIRGDGGVGKKRRVMGWSLVSSERAARLGTTTYESGPSPAAKDES
jgi:hypothetical protein